MSLNNKALAMALSLGRLMLAVHALAAEDVALKNVAAPEGCMKSFLNITQKVNDMKYPHGTKEYSVSITNQCLTGCKVGNVHLSCNPKIFEIKPIDADKLKHVNGTLDDCIFSSGRPIQYGAVLSFDYAYKSKLKLEVSSLICLP
ncbi:hypothetical protein L6164_022735 [Bauhinia variegata]|uniref:Uncharacterized protein n=1 Tax=Bauhinia variegata TaxID=167791 RepID=A0ACB9MHF5_BAUVA|nr:hypothetical protein L6164_022735 [Bauhinia variegata]